LSDGRSFVDSKTVLPSASFAASVAPIKCAASSGVPPTVGSRAYPIKESAVK